MVTGLKPRADHDATNASTQEAWKASGSRATLDGFRTAGQDPQLEPGPPAHLLPATETKVAPNNKRSHLQSGGPMNRA